MTTEVIALTVDVEDYFQVTGFKGRISLSDWDRMPSRVEGNTDRTLDLLEECGAQATFFILGWVARKFPDLIQRIASRGHEIASHGQEHRMVYDQSPEEFRQDVRRSKALLEEITGQPALGYRAPTFSITPRSRWAHGVLAEEGFQYSSSVFPVHHDRYGWPGFGGLPRKVPNGAEPGIWEFPLPFVKCGKVFVPFGGGGYLRLYPLWMTMYLMKLKIRQTGSPTVLYFHPWEIDPDQPRLPAGLLGRIRHYWGLEGMEAKIRNVLQSYRSVPMAALLPSDTSAPVTGQAWRSRCAE